MQSPITRVVSIATATTAAASVSAGITLHATGPSVYNPDTSVMDATLGITGYAVEDFEDTTLLPGLTYTLDTPFVGMYSQLPGLHDGRSIDGSTDNQWDGIHVLLGNSNNSFPGEGVRVHRIRFDYPAGARSFGVGLSSFQSLADNDFPISNHNVYVNGVFFGVLETIAAGDLEGGRSRNTYLRFDATAGDVITSVAFENITQTGTIDLLVFDHVAVRTGTCPADIAQPFGLLDLNDINAFVAAFTLGDPLADLAEPFGLLDLGDVNAFVIGFMAGCP